jgi:hypothetical protein
MAFIFGGILAFALGPIFVNGNIDPDDPDFDPNNVPTEGDVKVFLVVNTIAMIIFAAPLIFLFREKPKFPASTLKLVKSEHSVWTEFK